MLHQCWLRLISLRKAEHFIVYFWNSIEASRLAISSYQLCYALQVQSVSQYSICSILPAAQTPARKWHSRPTTWDEEDQSGQVKGENNQTARLPLLLQRKTETLDLSEMYHIFKNHCFSLQKKSVLNKHGISLTIVVLKGSWVSQNWNPMQLGGNIVLIRTWIAYVWCGTK